MASQRPDDRGDGARRERRRDDAPAPADERQEMPSARDPAQGRDADESRDPRPSGPPPGIPDEQQAAATDAPTAAEAVGEMADPDAAPPAHRDDAGWLGYRTAAPPDTAADASAQPGQQGDRPPDSGQSADRRDRFGWLLPEGMGAERDAERVDPPRPPPADNPYDTASWRATPPPDAPPRGPDSGQPPVRQSTPEQPPRGPYSGQFPTAPPDQARWSGAFPVPPDPARSGPFVPVERGPDDRRSGTLPTVPDTVSQSGAYAAPPDPGTYNAGRSGPIPQSPYVSGAMPEVQRSGQFAYPGEAIIAPDAGPGSLVTDRPALVFLLAAAALAGAMIAFIALRYAHFPDQIVLHFGPAGASQPTRIGEKRELWTIPFIVGIVLAADTALAWAVYRFDRFAARLLILGSALVAAIAWVVLLTVLHR